MRGILALFIRALREQVRGTSFAWIRGGMALAVFLTLLFFKSLQVSGAAGMEFFVPFACYNALMIVFAALSYFASAITEEKEEQTLGLLKMTNLSALAILFGKSTSRIMSGLMLLAVQFPFALLAVTLGGISWSQVAIVYALLCSFLFFVANLALFSSVIAKNGALAGLLTAILGFLFLVPSAPFNVASAFFNKWDWYGAQRMTDEVVFLCDRVMAYTGGSTFFTSLSIGWDSAPWRETVACHTGAGMVFFILSWVLFGRFASDEITVERRTGKRPLLAWLRLNAGRAWRDGVAWKDFHFTLGGWLGFWVKLSLYTLLSVFGCSVMSQDRNWDTEDYCGFIFAWAVFFTLLECAAISARLFRMEVRWQTLGSLYVLPQDLTKLAASKRKAMLLTLIPVSIFLVGSFIPLIPEMLKGLFHSGETFFYGCQALFVLILEVVFHYRLIVWFCLRLRWGGLAAALIVSFFGHLFGGSLLVLGAQSAAGLPAAMILWGMNVSLRKSITKRLEESAATA